jgi:adenine phosphoribosyltransferase
VNLKALIRDIPNFPKPGIIFKDITPLFKDAQAITYMLDSLAEPWKGRHIDVVVGAEARGFLIGPGLAERLGAGFVPIRKPGKLPADTLAHPYDLEYGSDTLEIHQDAIIENHNVLVVDDLLATGGTAKACIALVKRLKGNVIGASFIIELSFLSGRDQLPPIEIHPLLTYKTD